MKQAILALVFCLAAPVRGGTYDFRASEGYRKLAAVDRQRLEQVRRDQVLLWGALDMYADEISLQAWRSWEPRVGPQQRRAAGFSVFGGARQRGVVYLQRGVDFGEEPGGGTFVQGSAKS